MISYTHVKGIYENISKFVIQSLHTYTNLKNVALTAGNFIALPFFYHCNLYTNLKGYKEIFQLSVNAPHYFSGNSLEHICCWQYLSASAH